MQAYIKNFTKPGDIVLDPFGGYGVTSIESLMLGRKTIHIDLNPLSPFILEGLIAPVNIATMWTLLDSLESEFQKLRPSSDAEVLEYLKKYPHPHSIKLPKDADVESVEQLFTPAQLAALGLLKHLINNIADENLRKSFMLAFSSTVTKINQTYHPSTTRGENAGDSGVFRYYRYRIAPNPVELDVFDTFRIKAKKLIGAKEEIGGIITAETLKNADIRQGTATDLGDISEESVDYIYTDPPYGSHIQYLDLSIMWNAWLDLPVTKADYELEVIEGGQYDRTKGDYAKLITESMKQMYRVLKYDHWMSFVFQHKDPSYWHLIVDAAQAAGFEYVSTVPQRVGAATFKKRQNPYTVLHGQLIINFRKVKNPQSLLKVNLGYETSQIVMQTIEAIIAQKHGATLEEIQNELMIKGMEFGFLDELVKEQIDVVALLKDNFDYNPKTQAYHIRKDTKFKTQIPLAVRIKYYLLSYMKRMHRQKMHPTFDDIILNIMPLLKNGITPKSQTILGVLRTIAEPVGGGRWQLVEVKQLELALLPAKKEPVGFIDVSESVAVKK